MQQPPPVRSSMDDMMTFGADGELAASASGDAPPSLRRISRPSAGVLMIGEDMDKRLKKIEEYLERLPGIDENILQLMASVTGSRPAPRPKPEPTPSNESAGVPVEGGDATVGDLKLAGEHTAEEVVPQVSAGLSLPRAVSSGSMSLPGTSTELSQEQMNNMLMKSPMMRQFEQMQQIMLRNLTMVESQSMILEKLERDKMEETINFTDTIVKLQTQSKSIEEMLVRARVDIEMKTAENNALEQQVKDLKQAIVEIKSERAHLVEERNSVTETVTQLKTKEQAMALEMEAKDKENQELCERSSDLSEQLSTLKRSVKELLSIRTSILKKQHTAKSSTSSISSSSSVATAASLATPTAKTSLLDPNRRSPRLAGSRVSIASTSPLAHKIASTRPASKSLTFRSPDNPLLED